jgi:hypothetical protein
VARRGYIPDVTDQVLTPGESHATLTVAPALESLCGGWTIALRARLELLSLENGRGDSDSSHGVLKVWIVWIKILEFEVTVYIFVFLVR